MNTFPLTTLWLQILALIAVEVAIVALLLAVVQRWCPTAMWRRIFSQAALVASLVLAASELSGIGRSGIGLILRTRRTSVEKSKAVSQTYATASQPLVSANQIPTSIPSEFAGDPGTDRSLKFGSLPSDTSIRTETSGSQLPITSHQSLFTDSFAMRCLAAILTVGSVFVAGRACLGRLLLVLLGTRRKAVANAQVLQQVASIARNLRISRRIRIIESPRLVSPIAFGFIWPTIGLPLNFAARFSAAKQEAMLTHELAHLAAHDPVWYLLADLTVALLWWHPGIWWLRRQLQLSSELAADEASLMSVDGPRLLAECLVEMGAQLAKPVPGQLPVAGFRSDLGCRVQRLMRLEGTQWVPISRARIILARSIGPIALAGIVILCTAWAVPRQLTQGESMQTMKKNWQRVFATFATMAAIQTPTILTAQETPPSNPTDTNGASALRAGAEAAIKDFQRRAAAQHAAASGEVAPTRDLVRERYGMPSEGRDRILANRARYGLGPAETTGGGGPYGAAGQPENPPRGGKLEAKLRDIVLDEVKLDGLPLSEVLNFLGDECRKRDPEKKGINFLINPNPPQFAPSGIGSIDPATGLPVAATSAEPIDIASVNVRFNMPLRHVTMADLLDAIIRVADKPIQYSVEDYAVIFSLRPEATVSAPMLGQAPARAPLVVRTFHVDTNTFVGGLESAFGIKIDAKGKGGSQSKIIQAALKDLLAQLNVSMEGNKAIFYNELTATVMVRVAVEDLDVIQAAIQTLGGQAMGGDYASGYRPMPTIPSAAGIPR